MKCPKCMKDTAQLVGSTHYVCTDPKCKMPDGSRTQFQVRTDDKVRFPYNQIFVGHAVQEFFRKPYLVLKDVGVTSTTR